MKLGLGLYRHMLNAEHYAFARQAGATHIVAHLVDYFNRGAHKPPENQLGDNQPTGDSLGGWGLAGDPERLWTAEELCSLRREINAAGLELEAIENFDPAHWHDILLDGPKKRQHLENVKTIIRRVGEAGIPIFGYNFSIAGVCGRVTGPFARGGAMSVGMDGPLEAPIARGMVWNMVYDAELVAASKGKVPFSPVHDPKTDNETAGRKSGPTSTLPSITHDELWRRLADFLHELVPVAEQAGVRLAAHPDDPPMPTMRGQPRLVYQPAMYQRLLDLAPGASNSLEFCVGSLAEMTEGDIYDAVDRYSRQGRIAYVHLRNVRGKVPDYREAFIDDGDVDIFRVLRILRRNGYRGVLIPDHTPQMTCAAPWHAGMAHALGFMRAALRSIEEEPAAPA
jgi:mannonate dehydratase